jgi:hypothetical protein
MTTDELPALFEAYRRKEEPLTEHSERYGGNAGREAAVESATRAAARLGFSALTAALATACLDRCFLGGGGGAMRLGDQPWKARLAAVACVALAAKVEETRVPLLLDLQLLATGPDRDPGRPSIRAPPPWALLADRFAQDTHSGEDEDHTRMEYFQHTHLCSFHCIPHHSSYNLITWLYIARPTLPSSTHARSLHVTTH